ncbi:MAG: serine/threonine protein kinase, partial [Candidatus Eisenbacteria bacterium]|nr:serine/threonine protein kinase [Candidatus Eisenbacteria bacterium]
MTEREKQLLGKYELLSELGRGGMGAVYRAHDPIIGRDVAIKVILDVALSAPGTRERFQREARSAGRLSHENIVTLHDFDEWDGKPYLVMELLAGTDLRQAILDDSLPLAKRLDIALQVAKGLEFAHSQSVIHRDIKPANIMILENGRAKILDFGIARLDSDAGTMTHSSLGTPRYMSPEQIRGEPVDRRSDIFSFGVMLYEMFTGTNPFAADTVPTVVHRILNEDPLPMGQLDPQLDSRLQRLVARCMAKDAAQRISDLAEAIRELETIIADPTPKVEQTRANANADATTVVPRDRKHAPTAAPPAPAAAPAHGVPQAPRAAAPSGNARAAAPAAGAPAPAREPKREPDRSS